MDIFEKDSDALLDYYIDWTAWVTTGDTISASSWAIVDTSPDLTIEYETYDGLVTAVWVSGGVVGKTYTLTNTITTVGDGVHHRITERSIQIKTVRFHE